MTDGGKNTETLDAFYFMVREPNGDIGHRFTDSFHNISPTRLGIALVDMLRLANHFSDLDTDKVQETMDQEFRSPTADVNGNRVN